MHFALNDAVLCKYNTKNHRKQKKPREKKGKKILCKLLCLDVKLVVHVAFVLSICYNVVSFVSLFAVFFFSFYYYVISNCRIRSH